MKRGIFLFVLTFSFIILNQFASAETVDNSSITGNMISDPLTGKLTSQQVGLSIFVQTVSPYIGIISPKNETYLKNESILLNYTLYNGDSIWYNLDNSENITINSSIYFNISQGFHTLYMYSSNINDTVSSKISFTVNSSRFIIYYENYKGLTKGASTNFIEYTYEEIQGLDNINLENTTYGRIRFNEPINMTNDKIYIDNILDLDSYTNISANHIEINSTELPNFNKRATLWLYNLNFSNPRILKDGVVCPTNLCIKEGYTFPSGSGGNGMLKFNVTDFSVYSLEETPYSTNNTNPPSGGGGGGGGSTRTPNKGTINQTIEDEELKNLTIIAREIRVSLKQGESANKSIYILNNYNKELSVKIDPSSLEEFVNISETEFILLPGESKTVGLNFSARGDIPPDTYIGKILIKTSEGETYDVLTSIDVQSKGALFDVVLKLNEKRLPVVEGGAVWFTTTIYNLGDKKGIDINLKYTIKDSNGKIIYEGEGTDKIDTYLEKNGKIRLPKNIYSGRYILSAKVEYEGKTAVTSANFDVKPKKLFSTINILLAIGIIILILFILARIGKKEKIRREIEQEEKMDALKN
jgi:hypothetical protein